MTSLPKPRRLRPWPCIPSVTNLGGLARSLQRALAAKRCIGRLEVAVYGVAVCHPGPAIGGFHSLLRPRSADKLAICLHIGGCKGSTRRSASEARSAAEPAAAVNGEARTARRSAEQGAAGVQRKSGAAATRGAAATGELTRSRGLAWPPVVALACLRAARATAGGGGSPGLGP